MEIPDVIGFTVGEATDILGRAGISIESVFVTSPPKNASDSYDDTFRVLRLKIIDQNKIEILVCKPL